MKYRAFYCGELHHEFDETDKESVQHMNNCLAYFSDMWDFEYENGDPVFLDSDDGYRSACNGDYGPSCPWNAPGMSIHDFI